jgi:hypothetical protein
MYSYFTGTLEASTYTTSIAGSLTTLTSYITSFSSVPFPVTQTETSDVFVPSPTTIHDTSTVEVPTYFIITESGSLATLTSYETSVSISVSVSEVPTTLTQVSNVPVYSTIEVPSPTTVYSLLPGTTSVLSVPVLSIQTIVQPPQTVVLTSEIFSTIFVGGSTSTLTQEVLTTVLVPASTVYSTISVPTTEVSIEPGAPVLSTSKSIILRINILYSQFKTDCSTQQSLNQE